MLSFLNNNTSKIILSVFFLFPNLSFGSEDVCSQKEPGHRDSVLKLLQSVSAGDRRDIYTVENFIKALPETMLHRFVFVTESRSLQKSTKDNPRVLIRTKESEVIASFSTAKDLPGYDNVELMIWNGSQKSFDFIDVHFDEVNRKAPIVTYNPSACLKCHREPARPNFEPGPFWPGTTPFAQDVIHAGTHEANWYISLIKQIESKQPRMRTLIANHTSADISKALESSGKFISVFEGNFPTFSLEINLKELNSCRIRSNIEKLPFLSEIKYALVAAQNECIDLPSFLPSDIRQQADLYFQSLGISSFQILKNTTKRLQQNHFNDKKARQFEIFEKYLGTENAFIEMKKAEKNMVALEDQDSVVVSSFRYLLEPTGLRMNTWSLSLDPTNYAFASQFFFLASQLREIPVIKDIADEMGGSINFRVTDQRAQFCQWLKEKSLNQPMPLMSQAIENSNNSVVSKFASFRSKQSAQGVTEGALISIRSKTLEIFNRNGCTGCHSEGILGAPKLPFDDSEKFESLLKKTANSIGGNYGRRILDRVNRASDSPGRMPLIGNPVSLEDREVLFNYINQIQGTKNGFWQKLGAKRIY